MPKKLLLVSEKEASIVNTYASSILSPYSASRLVDGRGLNGNIFEGGCSSTGITSDEVNHWFSLQLAVPEKISRVQIVPRLGCCHDRGKNIRISIGPSQSYDPNEPLCLPEIPQLVMEEGLTDYKCTQLQHKGKFVKISRKGDALNLCEVKIFTFT